MVELYEIKSKADYIADLATGIMSGNARAEIPQELLDDIYRQLSNIADTLDEYHDFGEDD
jgi:hypothetical protein